MFAKLAPPTGSSTKTVVDHAHGGSLKFPIEDPDIVEFTLKLQSPEVKRTAADEIENLTATVNEIRQGFITIAAHLADFDRNKFPSREPNEATIELSPKWKEHREKFDSILEQSYRNATDAAAFMKQFDVILAYFDDQEYSMDDIKTEVQAFAKKLEARTKVAFTMQDDFKKLADAIRQFKMDVEKRLENAGQQFVDQRAAIDQKLQDLHTRLNELSDEMSKVGVSCLTSLGIGTAAVATAIMTLAPEAMYTAVGSFLTAAATGWEYKKKWSEKRSASMDTSRSGRKLVSHTKRLLAETKEQIKDCHRELDKTISQQTLFAKYQKAFIESSSDIILLAEKIDVIASIWQTIKSEMQQFEEQLDLAAGPDMPVTKFFPKKIAATRQIYKHLVELLENYANGYIADSVKGARK